MNDSAFPFLERLLSGVLGVSAKKMRRARARVAEGWKRSGQHGVAYSAAGFHQLMQGLGISPKKVDFAEVQKRALALAEEGAGGLQTVYEGRVERFYMNRLLLAVRLADGSLVRLRVPRGRELFMKGMRVEVTPTPGTALYELADRGLPRRKGRW